MQYYSVRLVNLLIYKFTFGFQFGSVGPDAIETAGPEVSFSLQWNQGLGAGFEFISDINAGMGWFPHAEKLVLPQNTLQPFVDFTLGIGW